MRVNRSRIHTAAIVGAASWVLVVACTADPDGGQATADARPPLAARPDATNGGDVSADAVPARPDSTLGCRDSGLIVAAGTGLDCRENFLTVKGSANGEAVDFSAVVDPGTAPFTVNEAGESVVEVATLDGGLLSLTVEPSGATAGFIRSAEILVSTCGSDSRAVILCERFVRFEFRSLVAGLDCSGQSIQGELVGCVDLQAAVPLTGNDAGR